MEKNDACTMYEEQEENNIPSETNCDVIKSSTGAGTNTTEIHTVVDGNNHGYEDDIQDGRRTEEKRNQYGGDKVPNDDEVILDQFNEQVYLKFCQEKLYDAELMSKLVELLHDNSSLEDFMSLVTQLADGTLDPMNMAFLLCLDVAKLEKCQTTTSIRFRPETKQFWEVIYRVFMAKS